MGSFPPVKKTATFLSQALADALISKGDVFARIAMQGDSNQYRTRFAPRLIRKPARKLFHRPHITALGRLKDKSAITTDPTLRPKAAGKVQSQVAVLGGCPCKKKVPDTFFFVTFFFVGLLGLLVPTVAQTQSLIIEDATNVPGVVAQNLRAQSKKAASVEVEYDRATDLLSIQARQAPLGKVLQEISQKAQLTIDSPNEELLSDQISVEVKRLPLEHALKRLLEGFNSAFFFSATDTDTKTIPPRLVKVTLLSKKGSISLEAHAAREGPRTESRSGVHPQPAVNQGAELIRAVIEKNSLLAKGIIESLKKSGMEREREKAVEDLLGILNYKDFPAYYSTLDALKELAPEKAVEALTKFLQGNDEEMRVVAITALGYLGDGRAIEPLLSVLKANDPSTRLVATSSLARIGGERATGILFQAYLTGDNDLKQAVAAAIAFHGNEISQKALANLIAGGQLPQGTTPQNVIASSLPPDKGHIGK